MTSAAVSGGALASGRTPRHAAPACAARGGRRFRRGAGGAARVGAPAARRQRAPRAALRGGACDAAGAIAAPQLSCTEPSAGSQELRSREAALSSLLTSELGKPPAAARAEARAAAARVAALATQAPAALATRDARGGTLKEVVQREPLGVVAAISAWNYPLLLGVNAVAPALLAGNAVLYKASEVSPKCGAAVAAAAHAAGIHPALLCTLPASRAVGKALAAQPGLGCVWLSHILSFSRLLLLLLLCACVIVDSAATS